MRVKHFLCKVLCITILVMSFCFSSSVIAASPSASSITGNMIYSTDIQDVLKSGQASSAINANKIGKMSISLTNTSITGTNINLAGCVNDTLDNTKTDFSLIGTLFRSYTSSTEGYVNYVADLKDCNGNFDVVRFLIKNDNLNYKYVLNKKLASSKIFILYLKDKDGNVITFEDTFDKLGIDFSNVTTASGVPEPKIDYLWFTRILSPDKIIAPSTSNIQRLGEMSIESVHYDTRTTSTAVRQYSAFGDNWEERGYAEVDASITDIPRYGSGNAQTQLTFHESTYRNGTYYSNSSNFTLQRWGSGALYDMSAEIALGVNSTVNNFYWDGDYHKGTDFDESVTTSLGAGYSTPFVSATVALEFEFGENKYNGSSHLKTLFPSGGEYPKNAKQFIAKAQEINLPNDGEYLNLAANISTIDSNQYLNYSTSSIFNWKFCIYYYDESSPALSYMSSGFGAGISHLSNAS